MKKYICVCVRERVRKNVCPFGCRKRGGEKMSVVRE